MKVFLAALLLIGLAVIGMCANILLKKDGQFPQTDVGSNENMRRLGIKCMKEEEDELFAVREKPDSEACSGEYTEACRSCGLYKK